MIGRGSAASAATATKANANASTNAWQRGPRPTRALGHPWRCAPSLRGPLCEQGEAQARRARLRAGGGRLQGARLPRDRAEAGAIRAWDGPGAHAASTISRVSAASDANSASGHDIRRHEVDGAADGRSRIRARAPSAKHQRRSRRDPCRLRRPRSFRSGGSRGPRDARRAGRRAPSTAPPSPGSRPARRRRERCRAPRAPRGRPARCRCTSASAGSRAPCRRRRTRRRRRPSSARRTAAGSRGDALREQRKSGTIRPARRPEQCARPAEAVMISSAISSTPWRAQSARPARGNAGRASPCRCALHQRLDDQRRRPSHDAARGARRAPARRAPRHRAPIRPVRRRVRPATATVALRFSSGA